MDGTDRDQWDRRARDSNRWAKFEQRMDTFEATQARMLKIIERLDGDSHDAVVRADERRKIVEKRREWIKQFGSLIGYLGAAVGLALGIMALFGG